MEAISLLEEIIVVLQPAILNQAADGRVEISIHRAFNNYVAGNLLLPVINLDSLNENCVHSCTE